MSGPILVTGGTGKTGRRLALALAARGARPRLASRTAEGPDTVRFDWNTPATWEPALSGVGAAYLLAPQAAPETIAAVIAFSDRAIAAGCRRLVLLSASLLPLGGPGHGQIHAWLAEHAPEWAVLRPSWFMQNFSEGQLLGPIRAEGAIYTAAGDGRVGFVSADDIAACAAACLTVPEPPNRDAILTGPRAISYDEAAMIVSRVSGRPVTHHRIGADQLAARHLDHGLTPAAAQGLAMMDLAIAAGAEDRTTGEVQALTGRPPIAFEDFARAAAASWTLA
ncbi:ergot alkaloid biosynthesis protein [Caulobacter sp. KR2-114]|uniref:ergot alkaloid biosynthesis protein n=1 Tax=Caulobacter sp. KR2-114 TaxID=3400912 RepID=UPI003C08E12C